MLPQNNYLFIYLDRCSLIASLHHIYLYIKSWHANCFRPLHQTPKKRDVKRSSGHIWLWPVVSKKYNDCKGLSYDDISARFRINVSNLCIYNNCLFKIPSSKISHFQNEAKCKTFLVTCTMSFISIVSLLASLWNRGLRQLGKLRTKNGTWWSSENTSPLWDCRWTSWWTCFHWRLTELSSRYNTSGFPKTRTWFQLGIK